MGIVAREVVEHLRDERLGDQGVRAREGEEGADHVDAQAAVQVHDEERGDEQDVKELDSVGALEEGPLGGGEAGTSGARNPADEGGAADPELVGGPLLGELALAARGLEFGHLGAAIDARRLLRRARGLRGGGDFGRFEGCSSTRGLGLEFVTRSLPRLGPCLQPLPELWRLHSMSTLCAGPTMRIPSKRRGTVRCIVIWLASAASHIPPMPDRQAGTHPFHRRIHRSDRRT